MTEFRSCHAAKHYLAEYIDSGRDIRLIRSIPISEIQRFDVWQCVFEKEPDACRELFVKEWYHWHKELENLNTNDQSSNNLIYARFATMRLVQLVEWKMPFTVDDGIKIILDFMGMELLDELIKHAQEHVDRRLEIVTPYYKPDNEWVGYAETVLVKLKSYQRTTQLN